MTAGYDPVALAVALFLAPGFLRVVREGLFYLQGPRFEEGSEGYRILRVVCVGVAGLAGCIALGYLGYSLVRLELLPALFFAASVAMNGWSVKKYVTVGITIPEKEDDEARRLGDDLSACGVFLRRTALGKHTRLKQNKKYF